MSKVGQRYVGRRAVVVSLGLAALVPLILPRLAPGRASHVGSVTWEVESIPELLGLDSETVLAIGREQLLKAGEQSCIMPANSASGDADVKAFMQLNLEQWRGRDVTMVDGWIVTEEEARLCACYALSRDGA